MRLIRICNVSRAVKTCTVVWFMHLLFLSLPHHYVLIILVSVHSLIYDIDMTSKSGSINKSEIYINSCLPPSPLIGLFFLLRYCLLYSLSLLLFPSPVLPPMPASLVSPLAMFVGLISGQRSKDDTPHDVLATLLVHSSIVY